MNTLRVIRTSPHIPPRDTIREFFSQLDFDNQVVEYTNNNRENYCVCVFESGITGRRPSRISIKMSPNLSTTIETHFLPPFSESFKHMLLAALDQYFVFVGGVPESGNTKKYETKIDSGRYRLFKTGEFMESFIESKNRKRFHLIKADDANSKHKIKMRFNSKIGIKKTFLIFIEHLSFNGIKETDKRIEGLKLLKYTNEKGTHINIESDQIKSNKKGGYCIYQPINSDGYYFIVMHAGNFHYSFKLTQELRLEDAAYFISEFLQGRDPWQMVFIPGLFSSPPPFKDKFTFHKLTHHVNLIFGNLTDTVE